MPFGRGIVVAEGPGRLEIEIPTLGSDRNVVVEHAVSVEIDHRDTRTLAREKLGDRFPDVAPRAGDDGDLTLEFHGSLPVGRRH